MPVQRDRRLAAGEYEGSNAMRYLPIIFTILAAGVLAHGQATTMPVDPNRDREKSIEDRSVEEVATSAPTSRPEDRDIVEKLVAQLGAREFKLREQAQRELAGLGESALAYLVPHVTSKDPEVAARVASLLGTPTDPALRVELAIRLIESTDPDWLERGVHMLFKNPEESYALFMERTASSRGVLRAICAPIREQFESWKRLDKVFQRTYSRMKEKDLERAEQMRKSHAESSMYCAEAAYWSALEALEDFRQHPIEALEDEPDRRSPSPARSTGEKDPAGDGD